MTSPFFPHKDTHALIPGTPEYVMLNSKGIKVTDVIHIVNQLTLDRLSWIIWVSSV